jgi:hypothetical protein
VLGAFLDQISTDLPGTIQEGESMTSGAGLKKPPSDQKTAQVIPFLS